MALGQQGDRQGDLVVTWREMPRPLGHVFYDRLQRVLIEADFDAFAQAICKPYDAANLAKVERAPTTAEPAKRVADNGNHARAVL